MRARAVLYFEESGLQQALGFEFLEAAIAAALREGRIPARIDFTPEGAPETGMTSSVSLFWNVGEQDWVASSRRSRRAHDDSDEGMMLPGDFA